MYIWRDQTFRTAAVREDDAYIYWPDSNLEHETQFYPAFKIFRYLKKYSVTSYVFSSSKSQIALLGEWALW